MNLKRYLSFNSQPKIWGTYHVKLRESQLVVSKFEGKIPYFRNNWLVIPLLLFVHAEGVLLHFKNYFAL